MIKKALALRNCKSDGTGHGGFKWPSEIGSVVKCDDWEPTAECGNGLHALLDGWGNYSLLSDEYDAIWQIVEVNRDQCIELSGKVKFESCVLVYSGNMAGAMTKISDYQINLMLKDLKNIQDASGDSSHLAASGNSSRLAASGYYSQLAASGNSSRLAASGNSSQLAASGDSSHLAASGSFSQLAASGYYSQLAASGYYSQLAASGNSSRLAASGDSSHLAASGKKSIAVCSGLNGKASAGEGGCIALAWWDYKNERYRLEVGYVGENGIEAGKFYQLNEDHKFIEA